MSQVKITVRWFRNASGKLRWRFVVNGKSESLRDWSTANAARNAGKREYNL